QGPRGPVGDKGPDGDQGPQGPVGDKGPDGDASADTALSTRLAAVEAKTQDLTIPTPATGFANVTDATVASIAAYGGAINTESEADLQTLARAIPAGDWAVQLGRINSEYIFARIPHDADPRNYQILDTPSIHGFQPATLPISGFIASGDSADSNPVYDYYLSNGTLANDAALALQATASVAHHGTTDFAGTVTGRLNPNVADTDAIQDNAVTSAKLSAAVRQSIVDAGNSGGSSSTPSAAGPLAATAITARSVAFDSAAEQRVALTPARADSWFAGKQILVDVSYTAQTQADLHFSGIVQGGDIPASAAGYRLHVQGQGGAYLVIRRISSGGTTTAFGVTDSTGFGGSQSAIQIRFYVLEGAKGDKGDQGDPGSGGLTQDQVDARVGTVGDARYLQLSGGELTGALTLHSEPAVDAQAANKGYVDRSTAALQNALLVFDALPDPSNYQVGQRVEIGLTQYGLTSGVANNLSVTVGHQVFGNAQNNRFGFVSHAFGNIDRALPELGTPLHNPTVASGGSLAQAVTVLRQGTGNPSTFSAYALVDAAEYARAKGSAAVRNDPLRVTANDGNSAVTLLLRRQAATVTVRGVDYLAFSVEANQDPGQTSTTIFRFWSLVSGADGDDVDFAFNASSTGASSNRLIGSETGWTALPNEPFEALQDRVDHLTNLVNHNTQLLSANSLDPSGTTWGSVDSSAQVGLYATPSQASLALVTTALAQDSFDAGDISFTENVTRFIYIVVPHGQGGNYRLRYDHTDGTSSYVRVSTLWNLGNGTVNGNQVTFFGDYGAASVTPAIAGIDLEVSSTVEEPRFNGTLGPHTVRVLSQTAYDAITTKETGVIYMVPET
ncbi:MAG: hypothetical protein OXF68_16780, partial [Gammaproteobacteria bacterium]|nr:hypothetical protein [Gammaproteobacteria bacterium]